MEENKTVKTFNMYKFIIKIIAAVLLITLAIMIFVDREQAVFILLLVSGGVSALQAIIRMLALIKSKKEKAAKIITLSECGIHILIGAYLILAAFLLKENPDSKFTDFNNFNKQWYLVFIAVILYTKSLSYFWQAILYKVESDKINFWLHVICMTLSVVLACFMSLNEGQSAEGIVVTIGIMAIVCALLVGGEAAIGYFNFRNGKKKEKALEEQKEDDATEEAEIEVPSNDEENEINEIDPAIIPTNDNDVDNANIVS